MREMNAGHDLLTPESVACNVETQDSLKGRGMTAHSYSSSAASGNRELINSCSSWLLEAVSSHLHVALSPAPYWHEAPRVLTPQPQTLDPFGHGREVIVLWVKTDEALHRSPSPDPCHLPSDLDTCTFRVDCCWFLVLPRINRPFPPK